MTPQNPSTEAKNVQSNAMRAISVTALGIVALFSYFFHIEYFPLFDLQAASSYLFAVIWVLAVLLILITIILLLPYVIIAMALETPLNPKGERKLSGVILMWMGFSMLSLIGVSGGVLLAVSLGVHILWGLLLALLLSATLFGIRTHMRAKKIIRKHQIRYPDLLNHKHLRSVFIRQFGIAVLCIFVQLAPLYVVLLLLSRASGLVDDDYVGFFMMSVKCAFFIAFVGGFVLHVVFISRLKKYWFSALCLAMALPLALSGLSQATGLLPMSMAQITKIGNFRGEKISISSKSCANVGAVLGIDCDEKTVPYIQLCNVHFMSRIGPETYLRIADQVAGADGKYSVRRIFLPTEEITSMQVNFQLKFLRLDLIDADLEGRGSACDAPFSILHGDSAFEFNKFSLTDSGKVQLAAFIKAIKNGAKDIQEVTVTGHADHIGSRERNSWLAARRAEEVKIFIERNLKNFSPRITIRATLKGSNEPLTTACKVLGTREERVQCEAPNRRVELEIIKSPAPKKT
jgi:outer membrane protein OmpA-like peptidoglycan-associated protein